jgi:hypothetical protein
MAFWGFIKSVRAKSKAWDGHILLSYIIKCCINDIVNIYLVHWEESTIQSSLSHTAGENDCNFILFIHVCCHSTLYHYINTADQLWYFWRHLMKTASCQRPLSPFHTHSSLTLWMKKKTANIWSKPNKYSIIPGCIEMQWMEQKNPFLVFSHSKFILVTACKEANSSQIKTNLWLKKSQIFSWFQS